MLEDEAQAKGCRTHYYRDADGDGYGTTRKVIVSCRQPAGYTPIPGDCNDRDATRNPGAVEVCDGIDQDCDGVADDNAVDTKTWYADQDGDGHGDAATAVKACAAPTGYVASSDDCDDANDTVYWGAPEACDGLDNDCNNKIDDTPDIGAIAAYPDADGDGYGLVGNPTWVCMLPPGFASQDGDCNDARADIHPGVPEVCDGVDQNCDGLIDNDAVDSITSYLDEDGDGHASPLKIHVGCTVLARYLPQNLADDCDDSNAAVFPGNVEVCNQLDDNCNGTIDENPSDATIYYPDADQDGFGDAVKGISSCSMPNGYTLNGLDCDDTDPGLPGYVDSTGQVGGSGTLADPQLSIQYLVDRQDSCIVVGSGVFQEDLDLTGYTGQIQSINGSTDTTIEGLGDGPVVTMDGSKVKMQGITLTGGGPGSWVYVDGQDSSVGGSCEGWLIGMGGGIQAMSSTLALEDVTVADNDVEGDVSTATRPECSNMTESWGGGLYADSSTITLNDVQMKDNGAQSGAAMELVNSTVAATRLRVTGAPAGYVSDIDVDGGSFDATNLLLSGPADNGLNTTNSQTRISQALVAGYKVTGWQATDSASAVNAIFYENHVAMSGESATWDVTYTDSYGNDENWPSTVGIGTLSVDPMLTDWSNDGDATNDNYVLQPVSMLIDAGAPGTTDLDGSPADLGPLGGASGF